MKLIGLKGRYGSGKDTAVDILRHECPGAVIQRESFADRMKYSGMCALGFDPNNSIEDMVALANRLKESGFVTTAWKEDNVTVRLSTSGRHFWQFYGTEAHRNVFGWNFWVDALLPRSVGELEDRYPGVNLMVVTDARFENEAERILSLGGEMWHIEADGRLGPLPEGAHVSEQPLPSHLITKVVPNNGTLEQFETAVRAAVRL